MTEEIANLYRAALEAEAAFVKALSARYGKREASEMRYRRDLPPDLASLGAAKVAAYDAYRTAAFPHAREA